MRKSVYIPGFTFASGLIPPFIPLVCKNVAMATCYITFPLVFTCTRSRCRNHHVALQQDYSINTK